jgi:hypothetical protein
MWLGLATPGLAGDPTHVLPELRIVTRAEMAAELRRAADLIGEGKRILERILAALEAEEAEAAKLREPD